VKICEGLMFAPSWKTSIIICTYDTIEIATIFGERVRV